ncbi:SAM-dependent methyltransferase [Candidatus Marinamargulisbacteria bacterium]|nr:SAM-dependent methyltransferase [Candidatus Marinamargulisbacteria bacterium]
MLRCICTSNGWSISDGRRIAKQQRLCNPAVPGYVYLVGVGPGDPDCITQRVLDVLAQADVVLYDYLVHPSVLAHVPQPATVVCVGKQRGRHIQPIGHANT